MKHHGHTGEERLVRVAVLTVSDTRTEETDEAGALIRKYLTEAKLTLTGYKIVKDEPDQVRQIVRSWIETDTTDVVITTGGTGFSPRDQTYEALSSLIEKTMDGFGEAFRSLSFAQVGARAMLSRATAGTFRNGVIFALPGSIKAVDLGMSQLIIPVVRHAVAIVKGT